jgi:uncharacterized protein (AIM24 family)
MPSAPQLLPTQVADGSAPGISYRLEGELVPVLHIQLDGTVPVYFEHHVLLWKYPDMQIDMYPLKKGLVKRLFAGMPIMMIEARSAGEIAFSRDAPGHVVARHLQPGEELIVREHQFLAATTSLEYTFQRMPGVANIFYGGGFFLDQFTAGDSEGVVWLHGYGNVFEKTLDAGEQIDVEPGSWLYMDSTVNMDQQMYGLKTGLLGGGGSLIFNRFTGPGRVGIQSAYYHPPGEDTGAGGGGSSNQQQQMPGGGGLLGGIVGGLLNN